MTFNETYVSCLNPELCSSRRLVCIIKFVPFVRQFEVQFQSWGTADELWKTTDQLWGTADQLWRTADQLWRTADQF